MNGCGELEAFLLGVLEDGRRADFEAHASRCVSCGEAIRIHGRGDAAMAEWRRLARSTVTLERRAASLMREARRVSDGAARERPMAGRILVAISLAAALAVGICFIATRPETANPLKDLRVAAPEGSAPVEILFNENGTITGNSKDGTPVLSVPGQGRMLVAIGGDRLGLGAQSEAVILERRKNAVSIHLEEGRIAVAARKRHGSEKLVVDTGEHEVRVVGTRFEVALEGGVVSIAVDEGKVAVRQSGGADRFVEAGRRLVFDPEGEVREEGLSPEDRAAIAAALEVPSAPNGPAMPVGELEVVSSKSAASKTSIAKPLRGEAGTAQPEVDLETIRRWVLEGEVGRAAAALEDRVLRSPEDAEAWMLLATCRQKMGDADGAIRGYEQVAACGGAAEANRGRFLAARLCQDGLGAQGRAESMLRQYLAHSPKPLEAEAMLRLAQAQLALGEALEARETASEIASRFPGSEQALAVQGLLESTAP
jgi:hypothetical protein